MKKVLSSERKPIKMWLDSVEDGALEQAKNLANLPFVFKHIALMPDCHQGYGMPIGGVMATENVVIPNAVGVDIGCGMLAAKTDTTVHHLDEKQIKNFVAGVKRQIPVGKNSHKEPKTWSEFEYAPDIDVVRNEIEKAEHQIGTLGGGNHFIELQRDTDGNVWVMIHSGSRNFGYTVAKYYNNVAKALNKKWFSSVPAQADLAFLPMGTTMGMEYMDAMEFAVEFALANRRRMLKRVEEILYNVGKITVGKPINIAHNYAQYENHFGKNVIVHRKGATSARKGEIGIIPGSQGTSSYIVEGLGNPDSFTSCSHGAGRLMSRTKAKTDLDLATEQRRLDELGVIHDLKTKDALDEAAGAYKDIDIVMENQSDLVRIVTKLSPLAVVKG